MRLTLRTLLAWLDDTLPPVEVRDIGKQVNESPYAQELVERIHRVTRQRRLSVPGKTGPDGTDPNIVAGYVDNDLEPEQVAEYEKKCLNSDVNLAEAASVHQILSLLGQKVHVPPEAKVRMYHLVKGRETTTVPRPDGVRPRQTPPVTRPIQPWVAPEPPPQSLVERFGPAAACLSLIALLSWSAYESLTPPSPALLEPAVPSGELSRREATFPGPAPDPIAQGAEKAEDGPGSVPSIAAAATTPPEAAAESRAPGAAERAKPAEPDTSSVAESARKRNVKEIPPGSVGIVEKSDGVLLRFSPEKREWERIAEGTALAGSDRLLCLAPFRAVITIDKIAITLIRQTQVRLLSKNPGEAPALELQSGRIRVDHADPVSHFRVEFAGTSTTIDQQTSGAWAVERHASWQYGQPTNQPPALAIHASGGELTAATDRGKQTLHGPGTLLIDPTGKLRLNAGTAVPAWAGETAAGPKDQKLGEQFLALFSKDRPVLADIVAATENESPVMKKLAISAVKALGDLSLLTPILSRPGDADARQSTAEILRELLAEGPQAEKALREQLDEEFGEDNGRTVLKLLIGYSQDEASGPEAFRRLVEMLSPRNPSLPVRELALDNLETLSGRDDQGYDPEKPDEKSYTTWKSLLNSGDLKPASKRKAAR